MKRVLSCLRWEVILQFRNGFYYATAFILAFWVVLYTQLHLPNLSDYVPGLLVSNLEITTFYFIGGLVMLEKGEGSLEARLVSPLRSGEYLIVKVLALSILVLVENLIVAALFSGLSFNIVPVALALVLAGAIFSLYGFLTVIRYDSINEYMLPSVLFTIPLLLPLLDFFGIFKSPLFYLHPIQAALVLFEGGYRPLGLLEWVYGLGYSLAWVLILYYLGRRAFKQFVTSH
ncbi:MAG: ABC transporter permease [Anaerolineae bacterium]|nr:ABC transporter permease [Anaerolineae bacterium]